MKIARNNHTNGIQIGDIDSHLVLPDYLTLDDQSIWGVENIPLRLYVKDETTGETALFQAPHRS